MWVSKTLLTHGCGRVVLWLDGDGGRRRRREEGRVAADAALRVQEGDEAGLRAKNIDYTFPEKSADYSLS